jgi:hypothetical protein
MLVGELHDSQSHDIIKYGHESPQDLEPRMTVMAKARSNLPDRQIDSLRVSREF